MNRIELIGRLTRKPELKYTANNTAVCRFTIAVNRISEGVDFIDCSVWNKQAENLSKYQEKGNLIAIEGSLRINNYEDKEGNKKSYTEVLVNNIEYLENKNKQELKESKEESDPFSDFGEQITLDENFLD